MTDPNPLGIEKVIAGLRAHASARIRSKDDIFIAAVALRRETDRGAVILAATAFEDELQRAIEKKFKVLNAREKDELFAFEGPLGTFSAKIKIAYAVGILDRPRKRIAEVLRVMRNTCAHSPMPTSFEDKAMMRALYFMLQQIGQDGDKLGMQRFSDERPDFPRLIFLTIISDLFALVTKRGLGRKPRYADLLSAYIGIGALEEQEDEEGQRVEFRTRSTRWDPED